MSFSRRIALFLSCIVAALVPFESFAVGLIRDAEIEDTLHAYANPIFDSAGIPPQDVRILIVSDPSINAYVAGGLNLFLHTGLILATTRPGELIGVMAHETGHIAGAHLSQLNEKSNRAMLGSVIGALLGAAVMAGGQPGAGGGILMGSMSMSQRNFLSGIRVNEASAAQAALRFLDANDISATGMLSMFETLRRKEGPGSPDPFLMDHPLTTERITAMRDHIRESTIPPDQVPEGFAARHARMVAKLLAFTAPYDVVMHTYPPTDTSVAARYARAIAEFRHQNLPAALAGMDQLLKEYPQDAFFYDTKGQMLYENGKLPQAEAAYGRAASLDSGSALIMTDYATVLVTEETRAKLPQAIALLERSKEIDDSYSTTWRELGMAYGLEGKLGMSYEALAEEAALAGDYKRVLQHVARARQYISDDPSLGLLLDDLERDAKAQLHAKEEEKKLF